MNKSEILKIAQEIRENLEKFNERNNFNYYGKTLGGACAVTSGELHKQLKDKGLNPVIKHGHATDFTEHLWVEVQGLLIDITYTQYNYQADPVECLEINSDEYKTYLARWSDVTEITNFEKELGWGKYSSPSFYQTISEENQKNQ